MSSRPFMATLEGSSGSSSGKPWRDRGNKATDSSAPRQTSWPKVEGSLSRESQRPYGCRPSRSEELEFPLCPNMVDPW